MTDLEIIPSKILNPTWKKFTVIVSSGHNVGMIIVTEITKKQCNSFIKYCKKYPKKLKTLINKNVRWYKKNQPGFKGDLEK